MMTNRFRYSLNVNYREGHRLSRRCSLIVNGLVFLEGKELGDRMTEKINSSIIRRSIYYGIDDYRII